MRIAAVACFAVVATLATACAPQPAPPARPNADAIRSALSTELAKFAPAIIHKDGAAVANLFTDDGTWILPDATTYTGHANIEAGANQFFGSIGTMSFGEMAIDKLVVVSDSEAVTFVHGDFTLTERGKAPVKHVNPFADYWKKGADGVWRIAYEVNAEGPAPAAAKP